MSDQYLDDISTNCSVIRSIAGDLQHLSVCLDTAGNGKLSDSLYQMSLDLMDSQKSINDAVSREITDSLTAAQTRTSELFTGIFKQVLK